MESKRRGTRPMKAQVTHLSRKNHGSASFCCAEVTGTYFYQVSIYLLEVSHSDVTKTCAVVTSVLLGGGSKARAKREKGVALVIKTEES